MLEYESQVLAASPEASTCGIRKYPRHLKMQLSTDNSASAPPTRRFHAALFDFDGTLADTLPLIAAAWNHSLRPIFNREFSLQKSWRALARPTPP
jgi:hypothetical protein